jgi:hypothetical protein
MNDPVSFELKENYLLVIGHGRRDSLADMAAASTMIYAKVLETKMRSVLVDYRNTEIKVHFTEAFNIVKRYEVVQPELKSIVAAAVFDSKGFAFGKYWSEISRQRGFAFEVFDDFEAAEKWLLEQRGNQN